MNSFHNNEQFVLLRSVQDPSEESKKDEERAGLTSKLHDNFDYNATLENRQIKKKNTVDYEVDHDEAFQARGRGALMGASLFLGFILACVAMLYLERKGSATSLFHQEYSSSNNNQQNHADDNNDPKHNNYENFDNRRMKDESKIIQDSYNILSKEGFGDATNGKCPKITPKPQIASTRLKDPSDSNTYGVYHPGVSMEEDPFEIGHANDFTWYPQSTTSECDASPLPENSSCSCWNVSASCCERSIHHNHKWGHVLVTEWFGPEKKYSFGEDVLVSNAHTRGKRNFRYPPEYFHRPGGLDYREVFFTRNFYESLVSGYLYHKTGHECWLDGSGEPKKDTSDIGRIFNDTIVQFPEPFPPSNHRTICQYLADVTEWQGMRVYAEYVMRTCYYTTINLYKAVQILEDPIYRKTLFVCFEDLNSENVTIKGNVIKRIVKFLYPGGQHDDIKLPRKAKEYTGGHATDHDAIKRKWLNDIARQLDDQVFGGVFANLNKMFGNCKENN